MLDNVDLVETLPCECCRGKGKVRRHVRLGGNKRTSYTLTCGRCSATGIGVTKIPAMLANVSFGIKRTIAFC